MNLIRGTVHGSPKTWRFMIFLFGMAAFSIPAARADEDLKDCLLAQFRGIKTKKGRALKLWNDGRRAGAYITMLDKAEAGDTLDFGKGRKITIGEILGHGDTTLVIEEAGTGEVYRIPYPTVIGGKKDSEMRSILEEQGFLRNDEFVAMYDELKENGIPLVRMNPEKSDPGKYVSVEKEDVRFLLSDVYPVDGESKLKLNSKEKKKLFDSLEEFARATWKYQRIGDFSPTQLAWNGRKWVLLDWGAPETQVPLGHFEQKATTFAPVALETDYGSGWEKIVPKKIHKRLRDAVLRERARQFEKGKDWFKRDTDASYIHREYLIDRLIPAPLRSGTWLTAPARSPDNRSTFAPFRFQVLQELPEGSKRVARYLVRTERGIEGKLFLLRYESRKARKEIEKELKRRSQDSFGTDSILASGEDYFIIRR